MGKRSNKDNPRVGLLVTCLVDLFRPRIGFASIALLEKTGGTVEVPETQTCCGQPAYNAGDRDAAGRIAKQVIRGFAEYDYVVVPSGSCAAMLKVHYPALLAGTKWEKKAKKLALKTYELTAFLTKMGVSLKTGKKDAGTLTYHDSCSGLRELRIKEAPRELLQKRGIKVCEGKQAETCCGFGGTFCISHDAVSTRMADDKIEDLEATGAETVVAGDLGCLLHLEGRLKRLGKTMEVRHIAEVLAEGES